MFPQTPSVSSLPTHLCLIPEWSFGERQGLGHPNVHSPLCSSLQGLGSFIQSRLLQVDGVDEHEAIAWHKATILLCHAPWHQTSYHDHSLIGVHGILWNEETQVRQNRTRLTACLSQFQHTCNKLPVMELLPLPCHSEQQMVPNINTMKVQVPLQFSSSF